MRHGGFVRLNIWERQVKSDPRNAAEMRNGNVQKPLGDGLVRPKRSIKEIEPKTPAPIVLPRPKQSDGVQPPAATPRPTNQLQKVSQ